jgi:CheY-like chemotaxis protein
VKLLLVEDEAINVLFIKSLVTSYKTPLGFLHARTGKEALDLAAQENPDLILMDVGLPDLSGLEVTKIIRESQSEEFSPPIIIGLTALSQPSDRHDCLEAGMNDLLPKPFNKRGFHRLLDQYLS